MQTLLPWGAAAFMRHLQAVPADPTVTGEPLPAAPLQGAGDVRGPFQELTVYASLGIDWANAWIRLVGRIDQMEVPLDLRQGADLQFPFRSQTAPGVAGAQMGLLFRVSGRPFTFYEVQVYKRPAALTAAQFLLVGTPPGGPTHGDRAGRGQSDLWVARNQITPFAVTPAPVGVVFPIQAPNPNGGRLALAGLSWTNDDTASVIQFQRAAPPFAAAVTIAAYNTPNNGGEIINPFTAPLWTQAGDRLQAIITGGGAPGRVHSVNAQVLSE